MALRACLLLLIAAYGMWGQAPDPVGIWSGVLDANGNNLTIVLHIGRADDGSLKATLDSPDQGATGLPVSGLNLGEDGRIVWEYKPGNGRFEGTLKQAEMSGRWKQGELDAPLTLKRTDKAPLVASAAPVIEEGAPSPIGIWEGTLSAGGASLRLVLRVGRNAEGAFGAVLDSPDQGAKNLPVTSLRVSKDGKISWEFKPGQGRFEGTIKTTEMTGTWTQGSVTAPLTLKKVDKASARPRPQTPQPPFPYMHEEVVFQGGDAAVKLAGTLTKPKGSGPFPAAVLISGSGPQDRDETIFEHKPFLVLADYLTRHGIAVLRYDDRGVGKSTGSFGGATTANFMRDAEAALQFLRSRKDIDVEEIGLIGHSEGAMVATMLAAREPSVDFVVLLAGLGVTGEEILLTQGEDVARAMGMSQGLLAKLRPYSEEIYDVLKSDVPQGEAEAKMQQIVNRMQMAFTAEERKRLAPYLDESSRKRSVTPWFRSFLRYDPAPDLSKIKAPVLALTGAKDIQVKAEPNICGIREALQEGGNPDVTAGILPGLNHLFQTAETGHVDEYAKIEETFAPVALKTIAEWIVERTHAKQ